MTLEDRLSVLQQTLEENTTAVLQLVQVLSASELSLVAQGEVACNTPSLSPSNGASCDPSPTDDEAVQEETASDELSSSLASDAADDNTFSYDEFKAECDSRIFPLRDKIGRDAIIAIIESFGVSKYSQLPPESYWPFIKALDEAEAKFAEFGVKSSTDLDDAQYAGFVDALKAKRTV